MNEDETNEEYFNLLGMFGTVLNHIGGRVEVPYAEIEEIDFSQRELSTWFDTEKNVFVYELREVASE